MTGTVVLGNLVGTYSTYFKLGKLVRLKATAGQISIRNLADSADADLNAGNVTASGTGQVQLLKVLDNDTDTNGNYNLLQVTHRTSATPVAGFGASAIFSLDDSTRAQAVVSQLLTEWVSPTHGSVTGRFKLWVWDSAGSREIFRGESDGSAPRIGFLGASAVVRPANTYDLRQALIDYGLLTTGGATPLDLNGGALSSALHTVVVTDSTISTKITGLIVSHASTGTPLAGFGTKLNIRAASASVSSRDMFSIESEWIVPTDGSRTSRSSIFAYDTAARTGIILEADGTNPKIGFLGASAIVRPSSTTDIKVALVNLGLYTTGGASPLDLGGGALSAGLLTTTSGRVRAVRVVTAAGAITAAATDDIIEVKKTSGAATTVNLFATPATGTELTIKDGKGDAFTNPITITPNSGNIDGASTHLINKNYGSVTIIYDGTQWLVI